MPFAFPTILTVPVFFSKTFDFMNTLRLLSLAASALMLTAAPSFASDFFTPGPTVPAQLSDDQLYPQGRLFLFSFYSVGGAPTKDRKPELLAEEKLNERFARYKKEGFTIIGPQYELNQRSLDDAQKHGFKVIYSVGLKVKFTKEVVTVSKEEIAQTIREQVKAVADHPAIVAWDLRPEELRPWKKQEMEYLETASRAIRESDPHHRPIYQYAPGHANAKRLAAIVPSLDMIGKGFYTNYSGMKNSRIWGRWTMEQEQEAIRTANPKAIPLAILEMFQQPAPEEVALVPVWARHDAYLGLISGAKGIIIFSLRQRVGFDAIEAYYQAYAQVGRELLGPQKLGDVFLFGEKREDLQLKITEGPAEVEMVFPTGGVKEPIRYPSVTFLNTAYGEARYLFMVNSANEAVTLEVQGLPAGAAIENLFDPAAKGTGSLKLQPLEVKAYRITRP